MRLAGLRQLPERPIIIVLRLLPARHQSPRIVLSVIEVE